MPLIYGAESDWTEDERKECMVESMAICDELQAQGNWIASGIVARTGFKRMVAEVFMGSVGVVAAREVSRFARNSTEWRSGVTADCLALSTSDSSSAIPTTSTPMVRQHIVQRAVHRVQRAIHRVGKESAALRLDFLHLDLRLRVHYVAMLRLLYRSKLFWRMHAASFTHSINASTL